MNRRFLFKCLLAAPAVVPLAAAAKPPLRATTRDAMRALNMVIGHEDVWAKAPPAPYLFYDSSLGRRSNETPGSF